MYMKIVNDMKTEARERKEQTNKENVQHFLEALEAAVKCGNWAKVYRMMQQFELKGFEEIDYSEVTFEELLDNCINQDGNKLQSFIVAVISSYFIMNLEE